METLYSSADFGIGIFIAVGILIFKFILSQSKKNKNQQRVAPSSAPNMSDYSSPSEDAIAQMLGEYRARDTFYDDDDDELEEGFVEVEHVPVAAVKAVNEEDEFKRGANYKIKKKKRSSGAKLIDSSEELKRAIILQEIISPPLSKRTSRRI